MLDKFGRIKLGHFPTPIEFLKNISEDLDGPEIYIKRDDCTGLASGGNKTRKLEFLMSDVLQNNVNLVVTVGAVQSNHARQTAAACAILGIKCLIILEQRLEKAPDSYMKSGNVFLNKLFGAEILFCPKDLNVDEYAKKIIQEKEKGNIKCYFIPVGGSNYIGELGYIECIREIAEYDKNKIFTHIILASGSGGTHSGSIVGKKYYDYKAKILGISVKDKKLNQENKVYNLVQSACKFISCPVPDRGDVIVFDDYVGEGYGVPTEGMKKALKIMAQREAILLDPVYSGKAFDGLLDLIRKNYFDKSDKILFIHTGGSFSLPAYEWAF